MITSRANPKIKFARELKSRKAREESRRFYVEGIRQVGDALASSWRVEFLITAPDLIKSDYSKTLIQTANQRGIENVEVSEDVFRSLSQKDGPHGIAAIVETRTYDLNQVSIAGGIWVGLDSIQDPGNLGTILRTGDAAGASGIILIGNCVDPFSPEASRASMGSIFSQKITLASETVFQDWKDETGYEIIGASDKAATNYRKYVFPRDLVLLMGSEQKGIQGRLSKTCDRMVSIPMLGSADSLNIAVAAGIILYEIESQREQTE